MKNSSVALRKNTVCKNLKFLADLKRPEDFLPPSLVENTVSVKNFILTFLVYKIKVRIVKVVQLSWFIFPQ